MRAALQKMKRLLVMTLALCLLVTAVCVPLTLAEDLSTATLSGDLTDGMVRVFLSSLGNPSQLNLTVDGSYSLDGTSKTAISRGSRLAVNFSASSGSLTLTYNGNTTNMGDGFRLYRHETTGNNGVKIAEARTSNLYPGDIQFVVKKTSSGYKLYTIAHVFIEEYLYGVLPYEMGASAPLEALKAQCISARTYTVRAMQGASANIYDVVDTTNDQVYNGTPTGTERCNQAVDATCGVIAMNGTAFAATYYTASNGGQIDSVSNIWGSSSYDYVRVKDDPYDLNNKNSQVRTLTVNKSGTQTSQSLNSLLVEKAKTVFGATNVTITAVSAVTPHTPRYPIPSRLYTKLDFIVTANCDGQSKSGTLTFDIFSELEGSLGMSINGDNNELWTVEETATAFYIKARRFGHGTGLSQRGAMLMGEMGYTCDEILAFYFEGCTLKGQTFVKSIYSEISSTANEVVTKVAPAATSASLGYGIVELAHMEDELALRMSASAAADVIMGIPHGAVVRVHGVSGDYCLVTYGETSGYVYTDALTISGKMDGKAQVIATLEAYGTVNNDDYLNLRADAGTSHDILAQIPTGTVLPLFDINDGWAYTQYGRESGYVSMDYIAKSDRYTGDADDGDATGAEVIRAGGVKLRTTPSSGAYVASELSEGVIVKVKYDDGSWSEVYYAGVTGFVPSSALKMNGITVEEIADKPASGEQYAQVSSQSTSLNMRDAASLSANIMIEIPRGETIIVTKEMGDWCAVRFRGMNGYCMTKYLTLGVSGDDEITEDTLYARVTTESGSLNLRKSASKSAAILTTIPRNTVITVLERGSTWSQVKYNGKTGYVMNEFLTFGESEETPDEDDNTTVTPPSSDTTTTYSKAKVTTASGSLNLRKKASSSAAILARIPQYTVIDVLEIDGTWTKVEYNGETGYVMSAFLTYMNDDTEDDTASTPTTPPAGSTETLYARVTTASGSLNLRKRASSSASIITTIPRHEVIEVVEKLGTWTKVNYNDNTGYVMTTFLTFLESEAATPPADEEQEDTAQMAQVTTQRGSLNLRKRASSSATILTTIPQYGYVQVISRDGTWTKVTYDGYTGYVMTSFLTFISGSVTPDTPDDEGETPWARVTTASGSLNLRAKASSGGKILDTIPRHEIIPVIEKGSVWSKVTYDGTTGYVKNSFLTFLSSNPNADAEEEDSEIKPNDMRDDTLIDLASSKVVKALPSGASTVLRAGCSNEADAVATILRGEYVIVFKQGEEWCCVEYEGMMGYLPTELLGL